MDALQLSQGQQILFNQFLDEIADCKLVDWSDDFLLKWLIARNFEISKAATMLRRSIEWRQINQVDEIVDNWNPPEILRKYYAFGSPGYDKFDCPVWICAFGRMDVMGILHSVSKRDYLRYLIYLSESSSKMMKKKSDQLRKSILHQTLIIDLAEFSVQQISYKPFVDVGLESIRITEANYPEGVRRVFLINVPSVFTMVFAMIKPFLGQGTLDKLKIFGNDPKTWKAALLEEIDASQLPVHYGGSMTDPDGNPMCLSKINMGGQVPKSYYLIKSKCYPTERMKNVSIPAGSRERITINIDEPRSLLRWKFLTEDGDIGFQIVYFRQNDEELTIVSKDRYECHELQEEGEVVCIYSGTYVVEFDNSYSYFRSKSLWHFIDIVKRR